ncbi:MAG TPA: FtsW/RodA/SpoVE family cell cycle protein [Solirubrobacteraceae bacterium]|nr:FtsW/RodA/SpoVE family cell cycle protein [Solirubrobacteraceae bacterium]
MNERNRELFALIPASLLVTAGFTAVFIQRNDLLSNLSLTYGLIFLGLCLAAHIVLRMTLPHADPYLFPLVAVLACFGLVMLYRLDEDLAREQAQWFVVGLLAFAGTIVALRHDHRVLERYRYSIALVGIVLLLLPRLGSPVNGAYLSFHLGPIAFQPAELAKIAIVIFLASYLRDTRQVLVIGARRVLGITFPPLKHLGPLLAVWGTAMALLFVIQDLGSSLMFFGAFLALVYVATNRISFVIIGLGLFALGARVLYALRPTIQNRVDAWLNPFDPALYKQQVGGSYQIAQSIFTQADGGLFGRGFGQAAIQLGNNAPILPAAHTDFIFPVIVNELGLLGGVAVLLVYLLIIERGFKTAMLATDSFSKLLATGLTAVLALQVFVIVGGVTKLIPLTGVTLPFISYGGSSIFANFILLALLLLVSDRARREAQTA